MLTPEERRFAADLFDELIDLSPEERERTIAARRDPLLTPAIVAHVRNLLEISRSDWNPILIAPAPPQLPSPGMRIGEYQLKDAIGEGGFGVVYRAIRRVGETESRVAIKFLRVSFDDSKTRERFDLERQILADLDHPGIAKLINGGTSSAGLPYLVAEYVDGKPVTDYCDDLRLNIHQRLQIFRKICEAVEYAHRRQVLHRDLKPANILITKDGGVKLLDFGIAKLLAPRRSDGPPALPRQRMFSLSHASPEQIDGAALAFSTDVYSLGVVLYELLSGQLPFTGSALWDLAEARITRQRAPTQPSELPADEAVGSARGTQPERLRKTLRGELDAIVAGSLRPNERERYSSVEALRLDIERFLAGLPVEVVRRAWPYRARKWFLRNRATSIVLLLAFCLMTWGIADSGRAQLRATRARVEQEKLLAITQGILFPGLLKMSSSIEPEAARNALLDVELGMLARLKSWPSFVRIASERQRLFGLRESAAALWEMNRLQEAEETIGDAISEVRTLIDENPGDSEWDSFYQEALKRRIVYRNALGMEAAAKQDSARLLEFEGRRVNDDSRK